MGRKLIVVLCILGIIVIFLAVFILIIVIADTPKLPSGENITNAILYNNYTKQKVIINDEDAKILFSKLEENIRLTNRIKLHFHNVITFEDKDKNKILELYAGAPYFFKNEYQVYFNGKTYRVSKDFYDIFKELSNKYYFNYRDVIGEKGYMYF
ncbi:MAG: hypothetical protein ACOYWZ_13760 [Bacillota bacterium]